MDLDRMSWHDLTLEWGHHSEREQQARADQMKQLLLAGGSANVLNDKGQTPLEWIGAQRSSRYGAFGRMAADLVLAGANPLTGSPPALKSLSPDVIAEVCKALRLREDEGKPMRSGAGDNALHILMNDRPWGVATLLQKTGTKDVLYWLGQARPFDGNTPLHCLWGKGGWVEREVLAKQYGSHSWNDGEERNRRLMLWRDTALFLQLGALDWQKNKAGETVFTLIRRMLDRGLNPPPPGIFDALNPLLEQDEMQQETPKSQTKGGPRL